MASSGSPNDSIAVVMGRVSPSGIRFAVEPLVEGASLTGVTKKVKAPFVTRGVPSGAMPPAETWKAKFCSKSSPPSCTNRSQPASTSACVKVS